MNFSVLRRRVNALSLCSASGSGSASASASVSRLACRRYRPGVVLVAPLANEVPEKERGMAVFRVGSDAGEDSVSEDG
jgi:hypothetical protein